jgi:hypothetical protein
MRLAGISALSLLVAGVLFGCGAVLGSDSVLNSKSDTP